MANPVTVTVQEVYKYFHPPRPKTATQRARVITMPLRKLGPWEYKGIYGGSTLYPPSYLDIAWYLCLSWDYSPAIIYSPSEERHRWELSVLRHQNNGPSKLTAAQASSSKVLCIFCFVKESNIFTKNPLTDVFFYIRSIKGFYFWSFYQRNDARIIVGTFYEAKARHVFCQVLHVK